MYTTKAYLQAANKKGESPIYLRYTYKRDPKGLALNLKVSKADFDSNSGYVRTYHPQAEEINAAILRAHKIVSEVANTLVDPEFSKVKELYLKRLQDLKKEEKENARIQILKRRDRLKVDLYNHFTAEDIPQQIFEYQQKINELLAKQKELSDKGYKNASFDETEFQRLLAEYPNRFITQGPKAVTHIKTWSKILFEFSTKTETPLTFDIFDYTFYNKYAKYLMYDRKYKYSNNNFGNHIKKLKSFLKWVEEEKGGKVNKGYKKYKVLKEVKEIIFFTTEELELLWAFRSVAKPAYEKYIDLCMFGNLTGLRYSDIKASYWKIENGMLKGETVKTGGSYNIPIILDSRIKEILEKYEYNLNLVSDVKYNKNIKKIAKELFEQHGINQTKIAIKKVRLKDASITWHYKWELLSSHSNRRGFCTRMYQEYGMSERDILLMIGSKTNEILRKYVRNSSEDLMIKVHAKMEERAALNSVLKGIEET